MSHSSGASSTALAATANSQVSQSANGLTSKDPSPSKPVRAYRLKMQGFTVEQISKSMRASERTVYRWLQQHKEEYAAQLQRQSPVNALAEHVAALEELERLALQGYRQATGSRDRHSFLKAAGRFRQQIIDLQLKVGVIPTSPKKLHVSMQDSMPSVGHGEEKSMSREEMMAKIIELVGNPAELPPLTLIDERDKRDKELGLQN